MTQGLDSSGESTQLLPAVPPDSALPEAGAADPTTTGHRRPRRWWPRRWWTRTLAVTGVVVVVLAAAAGISAAVLVHRYDSKVLRADILKDVPTPVPVADKSPMNFLVLGSDSRDPDARGFDDTGSRSDTIMIVHIAQGWQKAFIVSIPRDSYVYVDPAGSWPGGENKINAAMAFGGASAAAQTIYDLTKIPFNGAFVFNFGAVESIVDLVGTVHVCLPYDVYDTTPGSTISWPAGCQDMLPWEARYFMQMRKGTPAGDFARMYDQQLIVKALATQIANSGMLTNPVQLDHIISTVAEAVTVDQSTDLTKLILDLKGINPDNISFATTPYLGTMTTDAGSSVQLDLPAAQVLFQAILDDTTDAWLDAHPQSVPDGFGPNDPEDSGTDAGADGSGTGDGATQDSGN